MRIVEPARMLERPGTLHAATYLLRRYNLILPAQLLARYRRNLDMQIDPIKERPADLSEISLDEPAGAPAFPSGIAEESASARIHRRDQHEIRGKSERHLRARQGHATLLQWLPQLFEDVAGKLRQLIQEQDSVVSQAHLARPRRSGAAADQSRVRHRVMRRPEGPFGHQPDPFR